MYQEKEVFSEDLKRSIVEQVLKGSIGKEEARRRYGIRSKSGVLRWLRNFEKYGKCSLNSGQYPIALKTSRPAKKESTNEELSARIRELERLLEDEQLRSDAYNRMIDLAEKEFSIPIRKKSNTK